MPEFPSGRIYPFRSHHLSPSGFRRFSPPSRGAFQLSLTVLVRYRSRDVFSLGSRCLPASHGKTKPWYSGNQPIPTGLCLRDCHPLRCGLPANFGFPGKGNGWSYNPTYPQTYRLRVQFGLSPFRSPLLRGSLLVSFPPPTKMFPLGGFPLGYPSTTGLTRGRKSHSEIPGSKAACASPGLIAACHVLLQRPSRAIHWTAYARPACQYRPGLR